MKLQSSSDLEVAEFEVDPREANGDADEKASCDGCCGHPGDVLAAAAAPEAVAAQARSKQHFEGRHQGRAYHCRS